MKLNNKGFAVTGILYTALLMFLVLLTGILSMMSTRKVLLDKMKKDVYTRLNNMENIVYFFDYTGTPQEFVAEYDGNYKIELWGASGGNTKTNLDTTGDDVFGGAGAYNSGVIKLNSNESLFIYVGGKGDNGGELVQTKPLGGYNGGGDAFTGRLTEQTAGAGGGATDVRLVSGLWNDEASLNSRILVSAGGGGASNWHNTKVGGAGGGLIGEDGKLNEGSVAHPLATGGTNTSGGTGGGSEGVGEAGIFGKGGNSSETHGAGGGGGYYGGGGSGYISGGVSSGAGGSSFISGHNGCNAIDASRVHTNQPNHYSGKIFNSPIMIDGNGYKWTDVKTEQIKMPSPDGTLYDLGVGHMGDGYARITYLGK
ncbi:MAG: glycine rich domain-containing protein [Bacilli bacterium]|nr:glycine rich domain-containing protein [Bacilli bacterium]MDD4547404.1 glycine rich domain-containing protein [Bacilli bacterium]